MAANLENLALELDLYGGGEKVPITSGAVREGFIAAFLSVLARLTNRCGKHGGHIYTIYHSEVK